MILQGFISNQGDAWQWTQNNLQRALREQLTAGTSSMDTQYPALVDLQYGANLIGQRLGNMHMLLAQPNDDPRFGARKISVSETEEWVKGISNRVELMLGILQKKSDENSGWLVKHAQKIRELVSQLARKAKGGVRTRIHGNLHLAQILIVAGDTCFVNFEATSGTALHQSPLKDVADILCSFNDAAAVAVRNAQATNMLPNENETNQLITTYTTQASKTFYDAYFSSTDALSSHWESRENEEAALNLFLIDNRVNEIIKAEDRPEWLNVPLKHLVDIVNRP
jgi:maltose alpha-D-glucosyltransferase/alpha-amylase